MRNTPHLEVARFMRDDIIRPVLLVLWYINTTELLTFIAYLFHLSFTLLRRAIHKMQDRNDAPFPFMHLPPELRDMVYENLLEDPHYPPPRPSSGNHGTSWLPSMPQFGSTASQKMGHKSNFIFLANKQIYAEYMDLMCKKTTFHLTVAPHNYTPPATPAEENKRIWQISPQILKQIRKCDIKLVATSTMLGGADPRNMKPEEWVLARQMRRELSHIKNVSELNLLVKAIADPLWNPLWVWYIATQALRMMGSDADKEHGLTTDVIADPGRVASTDNKLAPEDSDPCGLDSSATFDPKFNRIAFALDQWTPGENYLKRDPDSGEWSWWCLKGHYVAPVDAELTVRQFCGKLFECEICHPEEDDEE